MCCKALKHLCTISVIALPQGLFALAVHWRRQTYKAASKQSEITQNLQQLPGYMKKQKKVTLLEITLVCLQALGEAQNTAWRQTGRSNCGSFGKLGNHYSRPFAQRFRDFKNRLTVWSWNGSLFRLNNVAQIQSAALIGLVSTWVLKRCVKVCANRHKERVLCKEKSTLFNEPVTVLLMLQWPQKKFNIHITSWIFFSNSSSGFIKFLSHTRS